ncbi:MAG: type II toxin-antitoxin system Phd/YefM family antitoxin [Oscillospiraceae bacterium]|nr:type II toxin-antitoxin system Phd/YefM family antitoxin [Oscillospiraceae bacterium]
MHINTKAKVSMTEANQNFSKNARLVEQYGSAVIPQNTPLRYLILDYPPEDALQVAADEDVFAASQKLMERNKAVYEELAK